MPGWGQTTADTGDLVLDNGRYDQAVTAVDWVLGNLNSVMITRPGPGLPQRGPNKMVLVWIRIVIMVITDQGFYISECDNLNWMSIPLQL